MKTSKLFLMSAAVVLFATVACNKDQTGGEVEAPVIEVEDTQFQVTSNSQTVSVAFNVTNAVENETVSASADADWVSATVGSDAVTLTVAANETEADRSATVTLSYSGADDVSVTVTQVVPVISATTEVSVSSAGEETTVSYSVANSIDGEALSASADVDWVTAVVDDGTITLTVSENTDSDPRTATVTLSYPYAQSVDITVVQDAPYIASYEDYIGTWVVTEETYWTSVNITITADADNTDYIVTGWQWGYERPISDLVSGLEGTTAFPAVYSVYNTLRVPTHEYGECTYNDDEGTFWLSGRIYREDTGSYSAVYGTYTIAEFTLTDPDNGRMEGGYVSLTSGGTYQCVQMRYTFRSASGSGTTYWNTTDGSYLPSSLVRLTSDSSSTSSVKSSDKSVSVFNETHVEAL